MESICDFSKIKLICSDIDNTLLKGEAKLPQDIKSEIWRLYEKGILFTFATGRIPYEVEHLFYDFPEKPLYVAGNGAIIAKAGKIVWDTTFVAEPLKELAEFYSELGMTIVFSYDEAEHPLKVTPWAETAVSMFPGLDVPTNADIWQRELHRMFFLHPQGDNIEKCRDDLVAFQDRFDICSQNDISIQIAPHGCTKASGVAKLASLLGLEREQVLCVGDAENDISMIKWAGIGAAVSNAKASLKQEADVIATQPCAMGVVEILRQIG